MKQFKINLSSPRRDINIHLPKRITEAQLWIRELLFRIKANASSGIVVKSDADTFMKKSISFISTIRIRDLSVPPMKTVSLKPDIGVVVVSVATPSFMKKLSAEGAIKLRDQMIPPNKTVSISGENNIKAGGQLHTPKKNVSVQSNDVIKHGGNVIATKRQTLQSNCEAIFGGMAIKPAVKAHVDSVIQSSVCTGGVVGDGMQLVRLRKLSDLDDMTLEEVDNMSLSELDYIVVKSW